MEEDHQAVDMEVAAVEDMVVAVEAMVVVDMVAVDDREDGKQLLPYTCWAVMASRRPCCRRGVVFHVTSTGCHIERKSYLLTRLYGLMFIKCIPSYTQFVNPLI